MCSRAMFFFHSVRFAICVLCCSHFGAYRWWEHISSAQAVESPTKSQVSTLFSQVPPPVLGMHVSPTGFTGSTLQFFSWLPSAWNATFRWELQLFRAGRNVHVIRIFMTTFGSGSTCLIWVLRILSLCSEKRPLNFQCIVVKGWRAEGPSRVHLLDESEA